MSMHDTLCIYNKQWEDCASDYAAGKLGKEVGI